MMYVSLLLTKMALLYLLYTCQPSHLHDDGGHGK